MADEQWRTLLTASRADPGDVTLREQAVVACRRAGIAITHEMAAEPRRYPVQRFRPYLDLDVFIDLHGRIDLIPRRGGEHYIPACRMWYVRPRDLRTSPTLTRELIDHSVPGLALDTIKGSALDFRHLNGVDLCWLSIIRYPGKTKQLEQLPTMPSLHSLYLKGWKVGSYETLGRFPNLRYLEIDGDGGFSGLDSLNLNQLALRSNYQKPDRLVGLPPVTHLDLSRVLSLTPEAVRALAATLPHLRELHCLKAHETLKEHKELEAIRIGMNANLSELVDGFPSLRRVSLDKLEPDTTSLPADPNQLTHLSIKSFPQESLLDLTRLTGLESLSVYLRGSWYRGPASIDLSPLQGLRHLTIKVEHAGERVVKALWPSLSELPDLRQVTVYGGARKTMQDIPGCRLAAVRGHVPTVAANEMRTAWLTAP